MIEWIRDGLEGRGLGATLRLYIFGLIALAPFAALAWALSDTSTALHITPLLVGTLVGLQYVVSYYAKLRGATAPGPLAPAPEPLPLPSPAYAALSEAALPENYDQNLSEDLRGELALSLPKDWLNLPYHEAKKLYSQAFDRVYLRRLLNRHRHSLSAAAEAAGLDRRTFRERWKNAGLPPAGAEDEQAGG